MNRLLREQFRRITEQDIFNHFVIFLILLNTVILGLLTFDFSSSFITVLDSLDNVILILFIIELGIKMYAFGPSFFEDKWDVFDLVIISLSALTVFSSFSVLRAFRVFKVLRLLRVFPELKRMIESTSRSLRSIFAITALLSIVVYIFAVMSVMLFGELEGTGQKYFGDLGKAIFSLFQVMTLDSWSEGMVRQLMIDEGNWVAIYFGVFILATTFTFLNMFIAVFTNAIASVDIDDGDDIGFSRIINELKAEIAGLKDLISPLSHDAIEEE